MEIYSIGQSLPGHPDCGTIQIIYSIPPGIQVRRQRLPHGEVRNMSGRFTDEHKSKSVFLPQGPEHPNPGQPFTCRGFPRFCFLPDSDKGRKVRTSHYFRRGASLICSKPPAAFVIRASQPEQVKVSGFIRDFSPKLSSLGVADMAAHG